MVAAIFTTGRNTTGCFLVKIYKPMQKTHLTVAFMNTLILCPTKFLK